MFAANHLDRLNKNGRQIKIRSNDTKVAHLKFYVTHTHHTHSLVSVCFGNFILTSIHFPQPNLYPDPTDHIPNL